MDEPISQSPKPQEVAPVVVEGETVMSFPEAMKQVIDGKKITRVEWKNKEIYCLINGEFLSIHKEDGKNYQWIVNDGDMLSTDWVVI
jgi:hypothetical protein